MPIGFLFKLEKVDQVFTWVAKSFPSQINAYKYLNCVETGNGDIVTVRLPTALLCGKQD